jgi:tRNA modification GTPase
LLVRCERGEQTGDQRLLFRQDIIHQAAATCGEVDAIRTAILAPREQVGLLHAIEQLTDVPFRDQQPVGKLLLCHPLVRADLSEHIELRETQITRAQLRDQPVVDAVKDAGESQPEGDGKTSHEHKSLSDGQRCFVERMQRAPGCQAVAARTAARDTILNMGTPSHAFNDTIAAIATPPGVGGVGIVRVSGPDAFAIGQRMFRPASGADAPPASHMLTYGVVTDPTTGEPLDDALVAFFRAPRSYTSEDSVEINAHGGPLILNRILAATYGLGARAARPGEMTLRAFLNGRIDLAQAEAVMALINAETDAGRRLAYRQLRGEMSTRVQAAREATMNALARIEAHIDFPDEEVPPPDPAEIAGFIAVAQAEVEGLLAGSARGRVIAHGLRVAIMGRPNVGKSSLLNALLGDERAIVTPIAGTTRDTIEERVVVAGITLHLVDTAGLAETDDPIERIGVQRSRAAAREADLLLLVVDASAGVTALDRAVATELRALRRVESPDGEAAAAIPLVIVANKSDLPPLLRPEDAAELWPGAQVVSVSCVTRAGLDTLEETIRRLAIGGELHSADALVSSARHQDALRRAGEHLHAATTTLGDALPLDFVSIDLRAALAALGEVTGETATDDLLGRIFAEFCIGK